MVMLLVLAGTTLHAATALVPMTQEAVAKGKEVLYAETASRKNGTQTTQRTAQYALNGKNGID